LKYFIYFQNVLRVSDINCHSGSWAYLLVDAVIHTRNNFTQRQFLERFLSFKTLHAELCQKRIVQQPPQDAPNNVSKITASKSRQVANLQLQMYIKLSLNIYVWYINRKTWDPG